MKNGKYDWLIAMLISVPLGMTVYSCTDSMALDVFVVFTVTIAVRICLSVDRYSREENGSKKRVR